ncbi:long-chain acyl-CoA synthetase [Bradyrhizobium liaoningense]
MNITHGLRRALQINPKGLATVYGQRRRNWGELGERVARLAGGLRTRGVRDGDRVAVLSFNSDRYLELYLATGWAGGVIVPLNIRWSALENEDALRDCRASVLLVDKAFAQVGAQLAGALPGLQLVYADDGEVPAGMESYEDLVAGSAPVADAMRKGEDLAGIFYTGGTTGRSKGVMLSHQNLMANALNALGEGLFPASTTYLHAAPMFQFANGAAMYSLLLSGGSNVIVQGFTPEGVMSGDAERARHRRAAGAHDDPDVRRPPRDRKLRPVLAQAHHLRGLADQRGGAGPCRARTAACALHPGLWHDRIVADRDALLHPGEHVGEGRRKGRHRGAGRATLGCEVRIVDENDRPVPAGSVGEIVVRGDTVMMGYWERPEETARAVVDGWMHTGDGGYIDEDGFIYVVDRVKDMIISGGENVYSVEVENALAQHPSVLQCAVIGIPNEQWGEQVHAVVVSRSGVEVSAGELIEFTKTLIAGYKCPRSIEITETPLPLSGAGKVLKRELRRPFWEGRERRVS